MLQLGQDDVDAFVESLEPSASFMIHNFWAVHFFLLAPICKNPEKLFMFLIQCDPKNRFCRLYVQLDLVFQRFPRFKEFAEGHFLNSICRFCRQKRQRNLLRSLVQLSKRVIFFESSAAPSFVERLSDYVSFHDILVGIEQFSGRHLFQTEVPPTELVFQIHVDLRIHWSHIDFALFCVNQILNSPEKQVHLDYCLVLGAFLKRCDCFDDALIPLIAESPCDVTVMELFHYSSVIVGKSSPFDMPTVVSPLLKERSFARLLAIVRPDDYLMLYADFDAALREFAQSVITGFIYVRQIEVNALVAPSLVHVSCLLEREQRLTKLCSTTWKRLWRAVSIDRAPWHYPFRVSLQWKRDRCPCFAFVPVKFSRVKEKTEKRRSEPKMKFLQSYSGSLVTPKSSKLVTIGLTETHLSLIYADKRFVQYPLTSFAYLFRRAGHGLELYREVGVPLLLCCDNDTEHDRLWQFLVAGF